MQKIKLLDSTPIINFNSRISRQDLLFLFITYGFSEFARNVFGLGD